MAYRTLTLAADSAGTEFFTVNRRRDAPYYTGTFLIGGTWGGGTVAWKLSSDNGTTLRPLKDETGIAMTSNSDDTWNVTLGNGSTNTKNLKVFLVLSGSTNPNILVELFDNN